MILLMMVILNNMVEGAILFHPVKQLQWLI